MSGGGERRHAVEELAEHGAFRHARGGRHHNELAEGVPVSPAMSALLFARDLVVIAVVAVLIALGVKTFLVKPFYIPSASMHPTLVEDDRLLVNLLVPGLVQIGRGDVIVFEDPGGWLPASYHEKPEGMDAVLAFLGLAPQPIGDDLIKRVIGLPGDHVVCCNAYGQVVINDVAVSEPYVELAGNASASGVAFDVTVPADSLWVMGDNRYNSEDSRFHQELPTHGFVPYADVVGRAFLINWPPSRISTLGSYPEVFASVPSREPE